MFKKVSIKDRLPEEGKPVPTIDSEGNVIVYKRFGNTWNMPKLENNHAIEYWLEEAPDYDWHDITTYEKAVAARPVDEEDKLYPTDAPYIAEFKKMNHVTKTINGEWVADFEDTNQKKWEPVFNSSGSGFAFSGSDYYYDYADSDAGSRLSYESEEKSDFVGENFTQSFKLIITNKK